MAEPRTVLRCGVLIDGSGADPQEDMAVTFDGSRLGEIGPWRRPESGARVVDYSDATVVPGLVDAHTHLCAGSPGSKAWASLPDHPAGIVAWGLASCAAALAAGVTTVVDCGSRSGSALTVRDLVRSGVASGPDVLAAGEAITTTAGHGEDLGTVADSAAELRKTVRRLVARDADLIKIMVTGGATDPHTNRRSAQYDVQELRSAIDDAHRLGRRVVGHANATAGIINAVQAGIDVVAHCNWLGPDPGTVVVDLPTVREMARRGVFVDLNLQGARRSLAETDGVPVSWPDAVPVPATRWELLEPLREAGVEIYLSSDAFGPAIGAFPADLGLAMGEWHIVVEQVIQMVTSVPARAFGLDDRGEVGTGRVADLAVFRGDLRTDATALGRPRAVYQRGELVMADNRLSPPAVARAHGQEAHAQSRLIAEVFTQLD